MRSLPEYDVVFLSYDEPEADSLYLRASALCGKSIKRLHGVRGVARAYRLSAELVDTTWYLLIDGDCELHDSFDPNDGVQEDGRDPDVVVWRAVNPVNGLEYGYGGVKFCRASAMRGLNPDAAGDPLADLSGVRFLDVVGCTTAFNQTPFHAWRGGFREVSCLLSGAFPSHDDEVMHRIDVWTTVARQVPFGRWARQGALDALGAAGVAADRVDLNDPESLRRLFLELHPGGAT